MKVERLSMRVGKARGLISWFLVLACTLSGIAQAAVARQSTLPPGTDQAGITVTTRFQPAADGARSSGMVLAGLAMESDATLPDLAVTWSPVEDGWFGQVWGLQLACGSELIPEKLAPKRAGNGLLQGMRYISLAVGAPVPGHEYETVLAYSPGSGLVTVSVTDLTDGTRLVLWGEQLAPLEEGRSLQHVMYTAAPSGTVRLVDLTPAHLPIGLEWSVAQPLEDGTWQTSAALDRQRPARLQLRLPGPWVDGELRVELQSEEGTVELAKGTHPEHLWIEQVDLDGIAPGHYELVTTFVAADDVWEVDRKPLRIGRVQAAIRNVQLEPGGDGVCVSGTLEITTDGPLPVPALAVDVSVQRHTFELPAGLGSGVVKSETVYTERLTVELPRDTVDGLNMLHAPFSNVMDWQPEVDAVWQVTLQPVTDPVDLLTEGRATHSWLGRHTGPFGWDGLLQVGQEYVNEVVPGVVLYRARGEIAAGPIDLYVLEVDLTEPGIRLEAMTDGAYVTKEARWPRALTSDMVMKSDAVAGVNGSFFFLDTMLPRSMLVRDWEMLRSPGPAENAVFGVAADGRPYVGVWEWRGELRKVDDADEGSTVRISGVNPRTHGRHGVVIYRAPWRHSPGTTPWDGFDVTEGVVEVVVRSVSQPAPGRITGEIAELRVGEPGVPLHDPDTLVISGRGNGAAALLGGFAVGDPIEVVYELPAAEGWAGLPSVDQLRSAVSGGVVLVRSGVYGGPHIAADTGRHPRAAVGVSYDRSKVYFLVADGRSQRSVGLTYKELADFFLHIGVFEALNLDSGGSSTMVIRPGGHGLARVMNFPSDGTERAVADGIGVYVEQ